MPDLPTSPKGAATSRRILDAATAEFTERGIAGARIDRIIAAAKTNKAQLYGYFGNKDALFDAVLDDCLARAAGKDAFRADDLPGWAVAVYDHSLHQPDFFRLLAWARLERRPAGLFLGSVDTDPKLEAVAAAQAAGRLRPGNPADLLIMVLGMALSWSAGSGVYLATPDEPAADHDSRRALLRETVARAVAP